ncbi:helix-turn-helix domain-containing protein [Shewanella sp. MBTL60-007]|uniref:helix-turn-helix domain-containing protein n=1 Tax=Shewanella sp. MBTL60-007 TaxID=2815911 RepID=UPI001BC14019|nr:helix-turn-helix transcriptional regulator [Shewanella sp. MBTL60-007]GIU17661.1 hypothetical protein TUM3792_12840 [Shewanella sp. MBTL60-007]
MELFSLLSKIRNEYGLTQAEMVEKLSLFHKVFANLDLITYSRWERGVSMPSTLRIIQLLTFAEYDVLSHLIELDLKLSKTKVNQVRRIEALAFDQEDLIQASYYPVTDTCFHKYTESTPLTDMRKLALICESSAKFFNLTERDVQERCERAIKLQEQGALHMLTCEGSQDNLYAHAIISVHNADDRASLIDEFVDFYNTPREPEISGDKILFFHSIMKFNYRWWEFGVFHLLKLLIENPDIKEIFMIVRNKNAEQPYVSFGFEVLAEYEEENPLAGARKLIGISRDDYLSHHGVISWLKEHAHFIND